MLWLFTRLKNLGFSDLLLISVATLSMSNLPSCIAQKYDNSWQFGGHLSGRNAGISMEFGADSLSIDTMRRNVWFYECTGSISDSSGQLLFYTNGCNIYDRTHHVMDNGYGIGGGDDLYEDYCSEGSGLRWSQGVVIFPMGNQKYQLYHLNAMKNDTTAGPYVDIIYRSVVDMSQNGSLGKVVIKNDTIFHKNINYGAMSAVRHANGRDWWLAVHQTSSDSFHLMHIDTSGVVNIIGQGGGVMTMNENHTAGQAQFSPDGRMYIYYDVIHGLQIFDFNRGTGELSNFRHIPFWHDDTGGSAVGGIEISGNSRYLYASSRIHLDQFDLYSTDIELSRVYIDSFDGFQDPFSVTFYLLQRGPDDKIYMSATNSVPYLHVINQPDSSGKTCDFQQHGIKLPAYNVFSMPYFPNYHLGADSSLLSSTYVPEVSKVDMEVKIIPNPVFDYFDIESDADWESWKLYSVAGRFVLGGNKNNELIDVSTIANGMYFIVLIDKQRNYSVHKLVKTSR